MNRPGDWTCRSCHRMNFQRRDSCQRCGGPRTLERGGGGGGGGGDYLNFGGRSPAGAFPSPFRMTGPDVRPGDWYCAIGNCGTHNFANRTTCFRCGAFREEVMDVGVFENEVHQWRGPVIGGATDNNRLGWRAGDWVCTRLGCNEHNFANRTECFRCNARRDPIVVRRFLPE